MEVKEVKQSLGKVVILESDLFYGEPMRYIFSAYIYRTDPREPTKRLYQAELKDMGANSILITRLENITLEEKWNKSQREKTTVVNEKLQEEKSFSKEKEQPRVEDSTSKETKFDNVWNFYK